MPLVFAPLDRIGPLAESTLLSAVDLLPVADKPDEHAPTRDSLGCAYEKLRLGRGNPSLRLHHRAVPRALRFVKHHDVLLWDSLLHAVLNDELVQVSHEHPAFE